LPPRSTLVPYTTLFRSERAREVGSRIAVLYLDIDGFKVVNDTLGHEAGDDLLRSVSRRLAQELGANDLMARMSGDEFVIVLEDVDRKSTRLNSSHVKIS